MNKFEEHAVANFLSDYDPEETFGNILNALSTENYTDITVWQPFEHYEGDKVAELILYMKVSLERNFKE